MKILSCNKISLLLVVFVITILATTAFSMAAPTELDGRAQSLPAAAAKPTIRITHIPPYGSYSNLQGVVTGVDPAKYRVAVYIRVAGGWWTKPYWARPTTPIYANGAWICDVTTGGRDQYASDYAAYLIPSSYKPPLMRGGASLPSALKRHSVARVVVHRSAK
jgi:hypothetical protein